MIEVWAPRAARVRLRRPGGADGCRADRRSRRLVVGAAALWPTARSTGSCSTTPTSCVPTRGRGGSRAGVHAASVHHDPTTFAWTDRRLDRAAARRRADLRAAHRHLHPRGHARRRDRNGSTTCSTSASRTSSCCRSTPSTACGTGATTACSGTPCTSRTAARRPISGSSMPPTPRDSPSSRTSSTTTSGRAATTCRSSARTCATRSATRGASASTSTSPRCASFIVENALMWLRDYHVDGLRLDAVHALHDDRARAHPAGARRGIRCALRAARSPAHPDRGVRSQRSDADPPARGGRLRADRAVERRLPPRGARRGDGRDDRLLRRLRSARSARRRSGPRGSSTTAPSRRSAGATTASRSIREVPTWRLVTFAQDHDQIGNRAAGDRLSQTLDDRGLQLAAVLTLTAPVHADAVHGRGVGSVDALAVLHLAPRALSSPTATAEGRIGGVRAHGLGSRRSCPTRRTPRPSGGRSCAGTRSAAARHARTARRLPRTRGRCAAASPH